MTSLSELLPALLLVLGCSTASSEAEVAPVEAVAAEPATLTAASNMSTGNMNTVSADLAARIDRTMTRLASDVRCPEGPGGGCPNCIPLRDLLRREFERDALAGAQVNTFVRELVRRAPGTDCPDGPGGGCDNCAPLGEIMRVPRAEEVLRVE